MLEALREGKARSFAQPHFRLWREVSHWWRLTPFPWAWEAEGEGEVRTRWWTSWFLLSRGSNQRVVAIVRYCYLRDWYGNGWCGWIYDFGILEIHSSLCCLDSSRANVLFTFMKVLLVIQITVIECASSTLSMLWSVWPHFYPFHMFDCGVFVFYFSLHLFRNLHPGLGRSFSLWYIGRSGIPFNLSQLN